MLTAAVPGAEAEPCSHKTRLAGGFLAPLEQGVSEVGFLTVLLSLESRHAALVHRQCLAEAGSPGTQPAGISEPCHASPACCLLLHRDGERNILCSSNRNLSDIQNNVWSSLEQQSADWASGTSEGSHKGSSRGCELTSARFLHGPNYYRIQMCSKAHLRRV